jgi:hypothetical protein
MQPADSLQLPLQLTMHALRQHGDPVLAAFASADYDLARAKVQVLDPDLQGLQQPETTAIHQHRNQTGRAVEDID